MKKLRELNTRYSTDNPTKGISDEEGLHLNIGEQMAVMNLLPERIQRTRYINNYHLEPLPQIPRYIQLPTYAFPLWQGIHDQVLDDYERTGIERIPIKTSIPRFLNDHHFINNVTVGKYSVYDPVARVKYLTQIPYTVTDCAKAYIEICEFLSGKKLKPEYNKFKDKIPANYKIGIKYFSSYHKGDLAYIDIKAAYWSILWPTTIDMRYDTQKQEIESEGTITYWHCDQFMMQKHVRNVMNTLFNYRSRNLWYWDERRIRQGKPYMDRLYRPYNLAYILDVMNAIITEVKEKFTLYQWLTDAAIVPANQADALIEYLHEEWFLTGKIDDIGPGTSNRVDVYKVGKKQTRSYRPRIVGTPNNPLRPANVEYFKMLRQQIKNGQLPNIRRSVKKTKVFGFSTNVINPSEYTPKPKLIAPKRPPKPPKGPMYGKKDSSPPENTINAIETFKKIKKKDD